MKMKKTGLILITFLLVITEAFAQENKGVILSGDWSYNIDFAQKEVHITGAKIENNSAGGKSGTLKIILYLTATKYSGGSISGYPLAEYTFGQLEGGYYYHDIDKRLDFSSTPPVGNYYLTLCLCEYNESYYIKDYLNFDNLLTIDNSVERLNTLSNALNAFSKVLNNDENNYNYNNSNNSNNSNNNNNYQAQYDNWANNARSNYTTLKNAKNRSSSGSNEALIVQSKRYLSQAQSNMRRIRSEASSNGVTISTSEYESISY